MHLPVLAIIAFILAMGSAAAASVRTLAFDLPANSVTFELAAADAPRKDGAALKIEAQKNQFGEPLDLPPGRYEATSSAFASVTGFTIADPPSRRFLLIVLPATTGSCHIFAVPDDVASVGPGDRFVINASGDETAIRFGSGNHLVKPGHSVLLHPPANAPDDGRIAVEMLRKRGEKWVAFNSTYWPLDARARSFVIIHPGRADGPPKVRNLSEIP